MRPARESKGKGKEEGVAILGGSGDSGSGRPARRPEAPAAPARPRGLEQEDGETRHGVRGERGGACGCLPASPPRPGGGPCAGPRCDWSIQTEGGAHREPSGARARVHPALPLVRRGAGRCPGFPGNSAPAGGRFRELLSSRPISELFFFHLNDLGAEGGDRLGLGAHPPGRRWHHH